jgi:hypothetical protein
MNYGFVAITDEDKEVLEHTAAVLADEPEDEHTNIHLYERTLAMHPLHPHKLDGLELLEISCGHGGGIQWIEKAHPTLKSVRGGLIIFYRCSFYAHERWPILGMDMTIVDSLGGKVFQGNSCNIPLPDASVDIASDHLGDVAKLFVSGAQRWEQSLLR